MSARPDGLVVRRMADGEFDALRAVLIAAFDDDESIGTLLDALRRSWAWIDELAFVAELDDDLVGGVLYTSALVDAPTRLVDALVLSPLGVRPDLHGHGVGSALVTETLATIRSAAERGERDEVAVFLEGSPFYYPRFGFRPGSELGFDRPSVRIPEPAFQTVLLPAHSEADTGRLVYPDAFWRTDSVGLRPEA